MRRNHWIMGSAVTLAAIAAAIDHTRHRLPEPTVFRPSELRADVGEAGAFDENPCTLDSSPCTLDEESPCTLDESPCTL